MEKLTLLARVVREEEGYRAAIDGLELRGKGATPEEAQDDLVEKFMSWVQARDGQGKLETALAEVGYAAVGEDTELELEFVE